MLFVIHTLVLFLPKSRDAEYLKIKIRAGNCENILKNIVSTELLIKRYKICITHKKNSR